MESESRIRVCTGEYKCVPAKRGQSVGCPPRHVKRCASYRPR